MSNPEGFTNCQDVFRLAIMKSLAPKRRTASPIFVACAAGVSCRSKDRFRVRRGSVSAHSEAEQCEAEP